MFSTQDAIAKTIQLQKQFICPIWTVWFGTSVKVYFTRHHAEQLLRALALNGTDCAALDGAGNSIFLAH